MEGLTKEGTEQIRKAAGSSDRHPESPSALHSTQPDGRPPLPRARSRTPILDDSDSGHGESFLDDGDSWDFIEHDKTKYHNGKSVITPPPSYEFPGTWDTALHESTIALQQVGIASRSYASALSQSGVGKAGWSISNALIATANKSAICIAGWGIDKSGINIEVLPGPVKGWLGRRERTADARSRARQTEEKQGQKRYSMTRGTRGRELVGNIGSAPLTFGDTRGPFVLETHDMDSTGEFVSTRPKNISKNTISADDGWTPAATSFDPLPSLRLALQEQADDTVRSDEVGKPPAREDDDGLIRLFEFDD